MNAYLALTKGSKLDERNPDFDLEQVVRKKRDKLSFYKKIAGYKEIAGIYEKEIKDEYQQWYHRYVSSFGDANKGAIQKGKANDYVLFLKVQTIPQSPLVVGLGNPSVLETSLNLHPIYGTPYLPGTALKGLTAHYAHSISTQYPELSRDGNDFKVLFGEQEQAGMIGFHDAWITPETLNSSLRHDVMTPHHPQYNAGSSSGENIAAPRDDDSPNPIPFLSVIGCFTIVLTCNLKEEQATAWLKLAKTLLLKALEEEGIGAKTAIGYGRMKKAE